MRCIRNAEVFCQKVRSGEKESNANRLTKRMARMHRILGVQKSSLLDVFITGLNKFYAKLHLAKAEVNFILTVPPRK
jgi:hypothetical protein